MNKYHKKLEELDRLAELIDAKEFTIDVIQEIHRTTVDDLPTEPSFEELDYVVYYLDTIIAIFNPSLEKDLNLLYELREILATWRRESELTSVKLN